MTVLDDLGAPVPLTGPVTRVVSLVPSITEAIALTYPSLLVGATDWCSHPADLDVRRVRGTKNPDRRAILELAPDLVVANVEENRELDVRRLREAGVPVWVTRIETVGQALTSLGRLFQQGLGQQDLDHQGLGPEGVDWLAAARRVWAEPTPPRGLRAAVAVWRDPWMVVGSSTYAGDVLAHLGLTNAFGDRDGRYPTVDVGELTRPDIDLVLLPDEPYPFGADDGPQSLGNTRTVLVSGRALTWYGPAMVTARAELEAAVVTGLRATS